MDMFWGWMCFVIIQDIDFMFFIQFVFIEDLVNMILFEEFWVKYFVKMQIFGFDCVFYGYMMFCVGDNLGDLEDFVILFNYDCVYLDEFFVKCMFIYVLMVKWLFEYDGSVSWFIMEDVYCCGDYSCEEFEVVEFNCVWGIIVGYFVSFKLFLLWFKVGIGLVGKSGVSQVDVDVIWVVYG